MPDLPTRQSRPSPAGAGSAEAGGRHGPRDGGGAGTAAGPVREDRREAELGAHRPGPRAPGRSSCGARGEDDAHLVARGRAAARHRRPPLPPCLGLARGGVHAADVGGAARPTRCSSPPPRRPLGAAIPGTRRRGRPGLRLESAGPPLCLDPGRVGRWLVTAGPPARPGSEAAAAAATAALYQAPPKRRREERNRIMSDPRSPSADSQRLIRRRELL